MAEAPAPAPVSNLSVIASPLAGKKLHKKLYKAVKKAAEEKAMRRGVKEVVKGLKKGEKGLCIIAGDISPIDVISHLPVLCEDNDVPYVFVTSKAELGAAAKTKRPTSCLLLVEKDGGALKSKLDEALAEVKTLAPVVA